jgi:outer membrane protein assembly factor BamB
MTRLAIPTRLVRFLAHARLTPSRFAGLHPRWPPLRGAAELLAALTVLGGCGFADTPGDPSPAPAPGPDRPSMRPAPGIDLTGPVALPDRTPRVRAAPAPLDLAADRAIVSISIPSPPRGGAVGFRFADDRAGWVTRIPDGDALPAVAYGRDKVFVSGGFQSVTFYALEAASGRISWATTQLEDNGPTAPVYDDGRVVFNTESCTVFALDAATGKRMWLRKLGDPTLAQTAVADGVVFAAHPADGGHQLSAFRVDNGAWLWSRWVGSELLASPVVGDGAVYASTVGGWTFAFGKRDGKPLWKKPLQATTAPWPAGDELFVTRRHAGKEQQIVVAAATGAIVREHDASQGSYAWDVPRDGSDARAVWSFEGSRPVVDRGVRYVAMGGEIRASRADSGEALWRRRYPDLSDARSLGSVALAGSQIVVSTRDGKLFGLDIDTGYTLWSYAIGHRVRAEPVIAKGWVYAATEDGHVVALEVADPTLDGWHMFGGNPAHDGLVRAPPRAAAPASL